MESYNEQELISGRDAAVSYNRALTLSSISDPLLRVSIARIGHQMHVPRNNRYDFHCQIDSLILMLTQRQ